MRRPTKITEADMQAAVAAMFRRHGHERFPLPGGAMGAALGEAVKRSWIWVPKPGEGVVTVYGRRAVEDYLPAEQPELPARKDAAC
jgi:hypothetical protein